jgi:hypothetical protein
MKVNRGWAQDFGKLRMDVTVDEEDLRALLAERGAADPDGLARSLTTMDKYQVMHNEARLYEHLALADQAGRKTDPGQALLRQALEYRGKRDAILEKYAPRVPPGE